MNNANEVLIQNLQNPVIKNIASQIVYTIKNASKKEAMYTCIASSDATLPLIQWVIITEASFSEIQTIFEQYSDYSVSSGIFDTLYIISKNYPVFFKIKSFHDFSALKYLENSENSENFNNLVKILLHEDVIYLLLFMLHIGELQKLIPEIIPQLTMEHNTPYHQEYSFLYGKKIITHTLRVVEEASKIIHDENCEMNYDEKVILMLAALLHDIGKPACHQLKNY